MICLDIVLKTSWQDVLKMSWKFLEDAFKMSWKRLEDVLKISWRRLENVLKTSWRRITKTIILVLTKTFWRNLEDVYWRRMTKANIYVLIKTSWKRLLKTKTEDIFIKANFCWVTIVTFGSRYSRMDQVKLIKTVFHKFYQVRSWIPWPFCSLLNLYNSLISEVLLEPLQHLQWISLLHKITTFYL